MSDTTTDSTTAPNPSRSYLVDRDPRPPRSPARRLALWVLAVVVAIGFITFWVWALFFASKESVNRIGDRAWAERAEAICFDANAERVQLADFRVVSEGGPELVREKADIIDRATDIVEAMLDDVVAVAPTDPKGIGIVPLWTDDYRTYIGDRRAYAEDLRVTGKNTPFYETAIQIPISEKLETFATENSMASCAPPRDLTR